MILFPTLMLSLLITIGLIPLLKTAALKYNAVDLPNHRKVHRTPVPKIGGVAMAIGAMVPILIWAPGNAFIESLLLGSLVLVVFGFLDDLNEFGYRTKLAGQIIAAAVVMTHGGLRIDTLGDLLPAGATLPSPLAAPLTLIAIVGVTNAINLSDGLDGLAGGISMMLFLCLAFVAYQSGMTAAALLAVSVVGAIFGFLRYNTHPAVIFMGDAGSQLLGYLAVTLAVEISQSSAPINAAYPLLLLGFPIADTLTVMTERVRAGRSPFEADKNHFHHKLLRLGLTHAEAVVCIYALQFLLVMSAFLLRFHSEWILLSLYLLFCTAVLLIFQRADRFGWTLSRRYEDGVWVRVRKRVDERRHLFVKSCFGILRLWTPLLLYSCCLALIDVPHYVGYTALVLLAGLVALGCFYRDWVVGGIRLTLFIMLPYLVFAAHLTISQLGSISAQTCYHLSYGVAAIMGVMTLKFTRRRDGFKANPFDFLIILVSLFITSIHEIKSMVTDVSLITTKMIALFFAFEVLLGEARTKVYRLNIIMVVVLGTVMMKSFTGL